MLCCCLPLGIAALVYSNAVNSAMAARLYDDAQRKSSTARALNIAATVIGLVVIIVLGTLYGMQLSTITTTTKNSYGY